MREEMMPNRKLNLLAIPSRTPLLYGILSIGIALILLMAFFGRTLDLGLPQLVIIFLVGLYYYLSYPDRVINRYQLVPLPEELVEVEEYIQTLAQNEVPHKLHILLSNDLSFTFGMFRHNYLVISQKKACELFDILQERKVTDAIDAFLWHEIGHITNKDVLYSSLSQAILVATASILLLDLITRILQQFAFSMMPNAPSLEFLFPNLCRIIDINDPQDSLAFLCENPSSIIGNWVESSWVLMTVYFPLILGCGLLLLYLWREVIRNREIFADAFVAYKQKTTNFIKEQFEDEASHFTSGVYVTPPLVDWRRVWSKLEKLPFFRFHDNQRRADCLDQPEMVYGSFTEIGIVIGLTIALLDLSLKSTAIARFLPPPHATVSFVLGFVLISISLLPTVYASSFSTRELINGIGLLVLIYSCFKVAPLFISYLIGVLLQYLAPDFVEWITNAPYDYYLPLAFNPFATTFALGNFHIGTAILFTILLPLVLFGVLLLDVWLKQRVLNWYALDHRRIRLTQIAVTGWLTILIWVGLLPILLSVTLPQYTLTLSKITLAIFALGATGIAVVWLNSHIKKHRICQFCNCKAEVVFRLGIECPTCGEPLHEWLSSTY